MATKHINVEVPETVYNIAKQQAQQRGMKFHRWVEQAVMVYAAAAVAPPKVRAVLKKRLEPPEPKLLREPEPEPGARELVYEPFED